MKPSDAMSFRDAAAFKLIFGKYAGRTLDDIATDDDGLLYLDWLLGSEKKGTRLDFWTGLALRAYLGDEAIERALASIMAERKARRGGRE